jgi:hypothetical protein
VGWAHKDKDFQAAPELDIIVRARTVTTVVVVVAQAPLDGVQKMTAIKDCFVTVALELPTIYWVTHYTGVVVVVAHNTMETQPMPRQAELVVVVVEHKPMAGQDGLVLNTQTDVAVVLH